MFQILTFPDLLPDAIVLPSGLNAIDHVSTGFDIGEERNSFNQTNSAEAIIEPIAYLKRYSCTWKSVDNLGKGCLL